MPTFGAMPTFGLSKRARKFLGTCLTIVFLLGYVFFAAVLGDAVVARHWAVQTVFFLVLGLVWIFPVMAVIRWMERPDPETPVGG